ncbi:MAG: hypothetical protein ACK5PW_01360 [Burkholderiales bacterium]
MSPQPHTQHAIEHERQEADQRVRAGAQPLAGVSTMTIELNQVLRALNIKPPSHAQQLSLL